MLRVDPSSAAADAVPAGAAPSGAGAAARALIEQQLAMLTRLAGIGMDIAEDLGRQARGEASAGDPAPAAPAPADLSLAFARVSRAVRLTIALQSRLMRERSGLDRARAEARRTRAHRIIERAIEAEHTSDDDIERLSDEAWERLNEDEAFDALLARPVAETVARICADLGVATDFRSSPSGGSVRVADEGGSLHNAANRAPYPGFPVMIGSADQTPRGGRFRARSRRRGCERNRATDGLET